MFSVSSVGVQGSSGSLKETLGMSFRIEEVFARYLGYCIKAIILYGKQSESACPDTLGGNNKAQESSY